MPKVSPLQSNFNSGEWSPLLFGRVDSDRYKAALALCENYIPTIQGGLLRRSGSMFINEIKDSSKQAVLIPFEFSITQAYMLEFGDLYIRFYKDNAIIVNPTPVEVVTTYLESELFQIRYTQSADVLYLVHPAHRPAKLTRTSHVNWTLTDIDFQDGPYMQENNTDTTLTPSGTTGSITVTASAVTGINGNQGFLATDIGRLIRIEEATKWGWVKISAFTDSLNVTADVMGDNPLGGTAAVKEWRLGLWSDTTGYPACVLFHEDRLFFGGASDFPERIDGSVTSDYENFAPTAYDGTVAANNSLGFTFNSNDVNVVRWMSSDEKGLLVGTVGGEWVVRPSSISDALSATNITAKKATTYGSQNVQTVQIGKSTIFVQRAGRKVRELNYYFDVDGFRASDLTQISEHVTFSGITQMAYEKIPQSIAWCVRLDGQLAGMTYDRDLDALKVGWHRQILGGESDAGGTQAIVESVSVIPSADGTTEDTWLIVKRFIDGGIKRYIEYFTPMFTEVIEQRDAFFVDCGLTYDVPLTITNITQANPGVVTSPAHGLVNGNKILISNVLGMDLGDPPDSQVNGVSYLVAGATTNTFQLHDLTGNPVDTTSFSPYVSGGAVRKYVTTISGLDHLEGQEVSILGDGAVEPSTTVVTGSITIQNAATTIHIGLPYKSKFKMMRLEAGAADGTALGKTRRMHRVGMLLYRTLGLKIGPDFDSLDDIPFRTTADKMTRAPGLFSGIISETMEFDYDFENQFCCQQDQPLPGMILAVMPQMVTQDRG